MMKCNLCSNPLADKLYESGTARSLTSLCTVYDGPTQVYFCNGCGHVQSVEIDNIDEYYDSDYDILVESEEEDQIYEVLNGVNIYRTEHQVGTLLDKIELPPGTKILDYGCAKSSTMRALIGKNPGLRGYLFDVSDRYIPFWKKFLSEDRWATYAIPQTWDGQFDVVTSFFSLEHMARPQDALRQISRVLRTNGIFYGIIPNVFTNTADMIVVDHVNHFTRVSLNYLLRSNGFEVLELDGSSHRGALIFKARKEPSHPVAEDAPVPKEVREVFEEARRIAQFWKDIGTKVMDFERLIPAVERLAIYGAGFYGGFIASCLQNSERIVCIIDQNPFLHGKKRNGVLVVSPTDLPGEIDTILIGLNPRHAKKLIDDIQAFKARNLNYFFM
jgi:SAM-dependent methyltransferase